MRGKEDNFATKGERFAENIRRDHRQEIFNKRRNIESIETKEKSQQTSSVIHVVDKKYQKEILEFTNMNLTDNDFTNLVTAIYEPDIIKQHYGIIGIRKLLSRAQNPPIQIVIDAGLVPKLIKYVQQTEYPQLQLQGTWCLTNIAAGNQSQCNSIIEKGGIKIFVDLLLSPTIGVVQQAIWAIGNIACDSATHRDSVIKNGGLKNLLIVIELAKTQLNTNKNMLAIIESTAWSLSNFCRRKPLPEYFVVQNTLNTFSDLLLNNIIVDKAIKVNILWAFSNFSSNGNQEKKKSKKLDKIQKCIDRGIVPLILEYFKTQDEDLLTPSIRIIGNITSGSFQQSNYLLNLNLFPYLQNNLQSKKKNIRRETCWTLANLASGNKSQIEKLLQNQNMISMILQLLEKDSADVKSHIVFIFSNMTQYGDPTLLLNFYKQVNIIRYFAQLLYEKNNTILLQNTLEALYFILELGQKFKTDSRNPFVIDLQSVGVIEEMQKLQEHPSIQVSSKMLKILTSYFQIADPFDF